MILRLFYAMFSVLRCDKLTTVSRVASSYAANFMIAVAIIPLLAPLAIVVAVVILVLEGYAPWYSEARIGWRGAYFRCYKLQTINPCHDEQSRLDRAELPSLISPVANIIRDHGLDELPQFLNLLNGTMALVGPRPMPPQHLETIALAIGEEDAKVWLHVREMVRPGLISLVHAKQVDTFGDETSQLDRNWVQHASFRSLIEICWCGVFVLILGKRRWHERRRQDRPR